MVRALAALAPAPERDLVNRGAAVLRGDEPNAILAGYPVTVLAVKV